MKSSPARIRAIAALLMFFLWVLPGCWKVDADLELSTHELNFGTAKEDANVTVTNDSKDNSLTSGVTALDYEFKSDRAWVSVEPVTGHLDGEQSVAHVVSVDRSALPLGESLATVKVTSNGGEGTITVRVTRMSGVCSGDPSAPTDPSPGNEESGVPLSPTLSWENGDSECDELTATYDVYFGTTNPPPLRHSNGNDKSWEPGELAANTLYYWRVVAKDANGSTAGAIWSFRTTAASVCTLGPSALASLLPPDDAEDLDVTQDLSWDGGESQCSGLTATYDVYFGTSTPAPLHHNNGTDDDWDPGTLEAGTTYYWRIVAKDDNGSTSSGERQFRTRECEVDITAPCKPSPPDGKRDVDTKADLKWECGTASGDDECDQDVTFVVYLGTSSSPDEGDRVGSTSSHSLKIDTLRKNTTYYWKVVASSGSSSVSSPVWSFTTRR